MNDAEGAWYKHVTGYQWLVLAIASAGWVFDIYEGQIFNITREDLLSEILKVPRNHPDILYYGDVFLGIFLVGGAFGGVLFGALADRLGRKPVLAATILMYSVFSGLTYFADSLLQVAVLRFLVAIGTGGEWSVGAALVAEVFSQRARAHAGSIFHASSILGTWMAGGAALLVGTQWRYAYLIGVLPAVLIVLVRTNLREPESAAPTNTNSGRLSDLLTQPRWLKRAVLGLLFAATGLGTFWGVTVAGQAIAKEKLQAFGYSEASAAEQAKFLYSIVQATGGGLGLLAFGPLTVRWGRRPAFLFFQIGTLLIVPFTCFLPSEPWQLWLVLPVFGFLTLGIHAGYAIYFPELFPTRLRATGAGFCFNGGRLVAAGVLFFSGWLKKQPGIDLPLAVTLLSGLALIGIVLTFCLPETRGEPLPE